jgi:chitodextrinase
MKNHANHHEFRPSLLLLVLLGSVLALPAATVPAASCSQSAVQLAIQAASANDIVTVPAGSCSWSGLTLNKAIHLEGTGVGLTNIILTGSNTITKQSTGVVRISRFTFTKSGGGNSSFGFVINGPWPSGDPVIIERNEFVISNSALFRLNVPGGVIISDNSFTGQWDDSFIMPAAETDSASWTTADSLGNRDTTGKLNIYVEANTFYGGTNQGIDAGAAARIVYRYNDLTYSSFNSHGYDTSAVGIRHFEVYQNTFRHNGGTSQLAAQNWAIWIRGGTGVIFNNQIADIAGSYWGDKPELKFSIRGAEDVRPQGSCANVQYPVPRQLGQNFNGVSYFTDPIYIWGNTGATAIDAGWHWGNPCNLSFSTFFQWGRDAVNGSPKPGYTPYTYPHPLRASAQVPPPQDTTPPTAPTGLSATPVSSTEIQLSWSAATDNVGVTAYRVFRNSNLIATVATTTYQDTGLASATTYMYAVAAVDAAGNVSALSSSASGTTLAAPAPPPPSSAVYYIDQSHGSDSNAGTSPATAWKNAPGTAACSAVCASTTLQPGSIVYFDRADTWILTGSPQGLFLAGGVTYIGDEWLGTGPSKARATLRAGNDFNDNGVVRFRDHLTVPTIFKGFEVDVNSKSANGIDINHGFWSLMNGATKRVQNVEVHHVNSRVSLGQYKYGIAMSNFGGSAGILENVEILDCSVHDISRDGIVLYPSDNVDSRIGNITVRGCEVYNTGQDPGYSEGHGIVVKGWVYNSVIEYNYIHQVKSSAVFFSGPENDGAQRSADNVRVRYNILSSQDDNGIIRLYKKGAKDIKIYGNLVFDNTVTGGLSLSGNSGSLSLYVYNNTFYNTFVDFGAHSSSVQAFEFRNNIVVSASPQLRNAATLTVQSNNLLTTSHPSFIDPNARPTGFIGTYGTDRRPNNDALALGPTSTALNAGATLSSAYSGSINSLARPQGAAWDIGAYEMSAGAGSLAPPTSLTATVQ